jgi:CheY-like chemotaxis protein
MAHSPALPWVVLVEDDEVLQQTLAGALERSLKDVALRITPDPEEALELARDSRSRLLITEEQSVSVDGLTLAACVRKQRPQLPLIFIAESAPHHALGRNRFDGSHLVDKPPPLDAFVGLVSRVLHQAPGFHGEVCTSGLVDLVQIVAMTTPTAALHLESSFGRGSVWFEDGEIVHVSFGAERGSAAFRRLLRLPSGSFRIEAMAAAPDRSVAGSTTGFLLENACGLDEDGDSGLRECSPSAAEYFESGMQAVRKKRYQEALPDWKQAAALDPENRIYQHNLLRLLRLLDAASQRPTQRR